MGDNKNNYTMATERTDKPKEQHVDPWTAVAAEGEDKIDYDKLISGFLIFRLNVYMNHALFSSFLKKIILTLKFNYCFCRAVW